MRIEYYERNKKNIVGLKRNFFLIRFGRIKKIIYLCRGNSNKFKTDMRKQFILALLASFFVPSFLFAGKL